MEGETKMRRRLIAFVGAQGSGKTTAAEAVIRGLSRKIDTVCMAYSAVCRPTFSFKFAAPIYDVLECLEKPKHRLFMQQFSDLAKEHFGINVFNEIAKEHLEDYIEADYNIICDDARFPAEIELLKELGFDLYFIDASEEVRRNRIGDLFRNPSHNSEAQVDSLELDCPLTIVNNGKQDEFEVAVLTACGLTDQ